MRFFGTVAWERGLVTAEQVLAALEVQARARAMKEAHVPIGEVLRFQGLITKEQLDDVLVVLRAEPRPQGAGRATAEGPHLGTLIYANVAVRSGRSTAAEILSAIDRQSEEVLAGRPRRFLGDVLAEVRGGDERDGGDASGEG